MKKRRRPIKAQTLRLPWGGSYTPRTPEEEKLIAQYFRGLWTETEIMQKLGLSKRLFKHRARGLPMSVVRLVLKVKGKTYRNPYVPKNKAELAGFERLHKAMLVNRSEVETGRIAVERGFDRRGRQQYEHLPSNRVPAFYPGGPTAELLEMLR